jgi:hypothetical protein
MLSTSIAALIYLLVFFGFMFGMLLWRRHQRKDRRPFPENLKLLRGPGETQRKMVARLDDTIGDRFMLALGIPVLIAGVLLWITTHLSGTWQAAALIAALVALFATLYLTARYLVAIAEQSGNRYLGYFGERIVAEALEPLKSQGFRIFHDVPCGDAKSPFNIDHVIVGSSGVFAVETKTRRKGRARGGFAEHEIIYDGQVLAYPWGEDRHGLGQAQRQAKWLADWLTQLLGQHLFVNPILTFPGWMIIRRGAGQVNVLNPKEILSAVLPRGTPALTAEQIDLIARQLDARCRDVEY